MFLSWSQWTSQDWAVFIGVIATLITTLYKAYNGLVAVSLNSASEQINRLTDRLNLAEKRLDEKDTEIERLRHDNFRAKSRQNRAIKELNTLKRENENQTQLLTQFQEKAERFAQEAETLRNEAKSMREDAEALRIRITVLESERVSFLERIEHLEEENKVLKEKLKAKLAEPSPKMLD